MLPQNSQSEGPPSVLHASQPVDGGVARVVADLVRAQVAAGLRVVVAAPPGGALQRDARAAGAEVVRLARRALPRPRTGRRDPAPGPAGPPDRTPTWSTRTAPRPGLAARLAVRGRIPTVHQPHAWSFEAVGGPTARLALSWERYAARWSQRVLCVSEAERAARSARRGWRPGGRSSATASTWSASPRRAGRVGRRGGPAAAARRDSPAPGELPPEGPLVVCVGRLCPQKGQLTCCCGPGRTSPRGPRSARLALVGDGPDGQLLRAAAPPGVHFAGRDTGPRPLVPRGGPRRPAVPLGGHGAGPSGSDGLRPPRRRHRRRRRTGEPAARYGVRLPGAAGRPGRPGAGPVRPADPPSARVRRWANRASRTYGRHTTCGKRRRRSWICTANCSVSRAPRSGSRAGDDDGERGRAPFRPGTGQAGHRRGPSAAPAPARPAATGRTAPHPTALDQRHPDGHRLPGRRGRRVPDARPGPDPGAARADDAVPAAAPRPGRALPLRPRPERAGRPSVAAEPDRRLLVRGGRGAGRRPPGTGAAPGRAAVHGRRPHRPGVRRPGHRLPRTARRRPPEPARHPDRRHRGVGRKARRRPARPPRIRPAAGRVGAPRAAAGHAPGGPGRRGGTAAPADERRGDHPGRHPEHRAGRRVHPSARGRSADRRAAAALHRAGRAGLAGRRRGRGGPLAARSGRGTPVGLHLPAAGHHPPARRSGQAHPGHHPGRARPDGRRPRPAGLRAGRTPPRRARCDLPSGAHRPARPPLHPAEIPHPAPRATPTSRRRSGAWRTTGG